MYRPGGRQAVSSAPSAQSCLPSQRYIGSIQLKGVVVATGVVAANVIFKGKH